MDKFIEDFEQFSQSWWPYILSLIVVTVSSIRIYIGGAYCSSQGRLEGKTVIVTGGASGIGLEVAKELSKRGADLILAIRNANKGVQAVEQIKCVNRKANVTIKILDMSEFSSIRRFVDEVNIEYEKIDILINNAATITPPEQTSEGNDFMLVTNYFGPFLLTHLLLPLLNKSEQGRVINLSAMAHFNCNISVQDLTANNGNANEKEAFAASKLALTIFTKHMAKLYKNTNITFNSVNPGLVRNTSHLEKYSNLGRSFFTKFSVWPWVWLFLKTPKQGSQSVIYLAVEPALHKVSGFYFSDCEIKEPADLVNDQSLAEKLYETSCKIVNIKPEEILPSSRNETANKTEE